MEEDRLGGAAAGFGGQQEGGLPNITGQISSMQTDYNALTQTGETDGGHGKDTCIATGFSANLSNSLYGAATEVRPINETFRIWKRTGEGLYGILKD